MIRFGLRFKPLSYVYRQAVNDISERSILCYEIHSVNNYAGVLGALAVLNCVRCEL